MCVSDHPTDSPFFRQSTSVVLLCDSKVFIEDHIEQKLSKSDHFERSYKVLNTKFV